MRKLLSLIILICLFAACSEKVEHDGNWYYDQSMKAYNAGDYKGFLENTEKAVELMPSQLMIQYNLACAYSLNGKIDESLRTIENLMKKGMPIGVESDSDFDNLRVDKRYTALIEKLSEARKPVNRSIPAFIVPEKDLIPEGLAYDAGDDCFYLGSLYKSKIVKITRDGEITDFTSSRQDGLVSIVGMKVDVDGRFLWASSSYGYKKDSIPFEELGTCDMVKYNLVTGELVDRYSLPKEENHFFNDVVLNSDKDAFITDGHVPAVYLINHVENEVKEYVKLADGLYPNGIALSENENLIYVAVRDGIQIIDVRDRSVKYLKHTEEIYSGGCDGLYFYKNSLIGIQGFLSRIARFHLSEDLNEVVKLEILESYNPEFESPTTGAIAGNEFYYIANAQLAKIDRDGNLSSMDKLNDVKILKVTLD